MHFWMQVSHDMAAQVCGAAEFFQEAWLLLQKQHLLNSLPHPWEIIRGCASCVRMHLQAWLTSKLESCMSILTGAGRKQGLLHHSGSSLIVSCII